MAAAMSKSGRVYENVFYTNLIIRGLSLSGVTSTKKRAEKL